MGLSNDLISQFIKATKSDSPKKTETTVYGTITEYNGAKYVKLDGSDLLTPITTTADMINGERVTVMIKDHTAIVSGNIDSPAARGEDVEDIGKAVSEFEIVIADKVSTDKLLAEVARITALEALNATITGKLDANEASIQELTAANVTITGKINGYEATFDKIEAANANITGRLEAAEIEVGTIKADNTEIKGKLSAAEGNITKLQTEKLSASEADIKYAAIDILDAATARIGTLETDYGNFKGVTTTDLTAIKGTIQSLDSTYANIDFTNIGKAAMEYFYAQSGLIQNVTVGDATITGELVGVTIRGDRIIGGTVIADKLVMKGTDGLYYKLNTDGVKTEAEQTSENSLDGKVILANSITATKIDVQDLVAFDATIGGFKIGSTSIYSGVKESIDNTTQGLYLGSNGQFNFGDANNYIKYFLDTDGKYKIKLAAQEIAIGAEGTSVEDALNSANDKIDYETSAEQTVAKINASDVMISGDKVNIQGNAIFSSTKDKIDNLEVGGRNLIVSRGMYWFNGSPGSVFQNNGMYVSDTGHTYTFFGAVLHENLVVGEQYTFSCRTRCSTNCDYHQLHLGTVKHQDQNIQYYNNTQISVTEEQTIHCTFTATSSLLTITLYATSTPHTDTAWMYAYDIKLEKGNVATDWTPAPEDVDEKIAATDAVLAKWAYDNDKTWIDGGTIHTKTINAGHLNLNDYSETGALLGGLHLTGSSIYSGSKETIGSTAQGLYLDSTGQMNLGNANNYLKFANGALEIKANSLRMLAPGNVNLLTNSYTKQSSNQYRVAIFTPKDPLVPGEKYTATICATPAAGVDRIQILVSSGYRHLCLFIPSGTSTQTIKTTFTMPAYTDGRTPTDNIQNAQLWLYRGPNDGTVTGTTTVHWLKVVKGDIDTSLADVVESSSNYLEFSNAGLMIGDLTSSTLKNNVLIDNDSVDIRNGNTTLASFSANTIYLGMQGGAGATSLNFNKGALTISEASTEWDGRAAYFNADGEIQMNAPEGIRSESWYDGGNDWGRVSTYFHSMMDTEFNTDGETGCDMYPSIHFDVVRGLSNDIGGYEAWSKFHMNADRFWLMADTIDLDGRIPSLHADSLYLPNKTPIMMARTTGAYNPILSLSNGNSVHVGVHDPAYTSAVSYLTSNLYLNAKNLWHKVAEGGVLSEYKPYYCAGQSITATWHGCGFVTNSSKDVYFTYHFSKPVIGNPTITVTNESGFVMRQNNAYTHGSSASAPVKPTLSAYAKNTDSIVIKATFTAITNVTNNSPIGIAAGIKITFS